MAELIDHVLEDLRQLWLENPAIQAEADRFAARLLTLAHNQRPDALRLAELAAALLLCRLYLAPAKWDAYLTATEPKVRAALGAGWRDDAPQALLRWPR